MLNASHCQAVAHICAFLVGSLALDHILEQRPSTFFFWMVPSGGSFPTPAAFSRGSAAVSQEIHFLCWILAFTLSMVSDISTSGEAVLLVNVLIKVCLPRRISRAARDTPIQCIQVIIGCV